MLRMLMLLLTLGLTGPIYAQRDLPLADAGTITCDYPQGGGIGKWVTSKAGFSATVELRASVSGAGPNRKCTTSWILHRRGKDGRESIISASERADTPEDNEWVEENSFALNAFSDDGRKVLASQIEAQGDWDETTPIILDLRSGSRWRIELYPLFKELIPPNCYVVYRTLRFTNRERVLISAASTDDDLEPGAKQCFAESFWELDYRTNMIKRVNSPLGKISKTK